jgi:hypothetical protein
LAFLLVLVPKVARAGDLERARELASRGELAAAEEVLAAAIPELEGDARHDARLLRAEVAGRRPERASFERARALYEELVREKGDDDLARASLDELLWERGERLVRASRRVDDPGPLVREAAETWSDADRYLAAEWSALDAQAGPAADAALRACGFYWPRCLASLGRLEGKPALLAKAVDLWSDFGVRFGATLEGHEAAVDMAEALLDLGRGEEALGAVETGLTDLVGNGKLEPEVLAVLERASLVEARILLARSKPRKALAAVEAALDAARRSGGDEGELALLLGIERAEAWARDGKTREALDELGRLAARGGTGPAGELALERIERIAGAVPAVSSERALAKMSEALERGQRRLASAQARAALAAARRAGRPARAAQALEGLGRALEGERRVLEAAVAYEEAASLAAAAASDAASRAALGLVRCCEETRTRAPGPFSDTACERALDLLARRDPGARRGLAPFLRAKELQEQGRFGDAARAYDEVEPGSGKLRDEALYAGACCRFALAHGASDALAAIEARLRELLSRPRSEVQDRARPLLAEVLLAEAKPADALAAFGDAPGAATSPAALAYRSIALVRLGRPAEAEPLVQALLRGPFERRTGAACRELALALEKRAATLAPGERRGAQAGIAPYLQGWLDAGNAESAGTSGREAAAVGREAAAIGREAAAIGREAFLLGLSVLGFPEEGGFLVELDGPPAAEAKPLLLVAARGFERALADAAARPGDARDRWKLLACRAEALGFAAEWRESSAAFAALAAEVRLLGERGEVDPGVLAAEPILLAYLADMGVSQLEAGDREAGRSRLTAVVGAAREASRLWWQARLALLRADDREGTAEALGRLRLDLRALGRKYPDFEAAKGLAPRFLELDRKYGG